MIEPAPIVLGDNVAYALPLRAGGVLLIDAGPDFEDPEGTSWERAVEQARAHGFTPADVRAVIVTHAHVDHAGLAWRWAAEGAEVVAGGADLPALAAGAAGNEAQREPRLAELRRHGCPDDLVQRLGALRGRGRLGWRGCPPGCLIDARTRSAFPLESGASLELIDAPGHTPGNLVAAIGDRALLFSGDTLLPTTIPTPGLHFPAAIEGDPSAGRWPSLPSFIRSIHALRALDPQRLLPGHGDPVDEPGPLVERFLAHHERRGRRIRAALGETNEPRSAYEIARRLFPRLPERRIGQAMAEVIGHLDLLTEAAAVGIETLGGVRRYRRHPSMLEIATPEMLHDAG